MARTRKAKAAEEEKLAASKSTTGPESDVPVGAKLGQKRLREDGDSVNQPAATPPKKAKKNSSTVATKDPKPERKKNTSNTRVKQPSSPRRSIRPTTKPPPATPLKRKRRTKAEMEEARAQKDAEKKKKEQLTEENHELMRQMDVAEDIDRQATANHMVRTFSDLDRESQSSGEEFCGYHDIAASESEDDEQIGESVDAIKLKEANKALQQKIKALEAQMDGGLKKRDGGKRSHNVMFASGLRADWNTNKDIQRHPRNDRGNVQRTSHVQISVGGLDDSDAEDINPSPSPVKRHGVKHAPSNTKRDFSRRNDLVSIQNADDKEYVPPRPLPERKVKAFAPNKRTEDPAPTRSQLKPASGPNAKTRRVTCNTVRLSDLPEFACAKWRTRFLPTLYDKFYASERPFDDFQKDSDHFIALLQKIVEEVYPNVDYTVSSSDSIYYLAYNRINEKRSNIGSAAIELLESHINTLGSDDAAAAWIRWSFRMDGPLYFKVPSPAGSPMDPKDPDYQFPSGRLLSPFIIDIAAPFLKLAAGSASENGFPKGLVALIMASLERAVRYLSKPTTKPKEFSKQFWGAKVDIYYKGLHGKNGISDARWRELIGLCEGENSDPEDDESDNAGTREADLSIMDNNRAFMFDFSSPAKN